MPSSIETFEWHPEFAGKSFEAVQRDLMEEIARDQRAYHLALDGAESEEYGAFNRVRELDKRWSAYDFGWFDLDPDLLARRILTFERAREERQELITWEDWRNQSATTIPPADSKPEKRDWRENISDEQRRKLASALSILIILGLIVACTVVYTLIS